MFASACGRASSFTRPVATSTRLVDGTISTVFGTFIVLNNEGWAITAGHTFDSFARFQSDQNKIRELDGLNADRTGADVIRKDPKLITNHSFWWGWDGVQLNNVTVNRKIDIAIGRLQNFDPSKVGGFPVLADPSTVVLGRTVCRLGYPFMGLKTEFDEKLNGFRIPRIDHRSNLYCNDGMVSRIFSPGKGPDGVDVTYIDTSTPGIQGQSGGPLVDADGNLCGMQVSIYSIPMGIQPTIECDGSRVVENQFVNIGRALHVGTIREMLDARGIRYRSVDNPEEYRIDY